MLPNLSKNMLLGSPDARLISIYLNSFDRCIYEMTIYVSTIICFYILIHVSLDGCVELGFDWLTKVCRNMYSIVLLRERKLISLQQMISKISTKSHLWLRYPFVFLHFQRISTPRCVSRWMIATTNHVTPTSL